MKKLFTGLAIVIFSAFGLSDALAATVKVLVVAGGGGGNSVPQAYGGGGAGGLIYTAAKNVSAGDITVTVGAGGTQTATGTTRGGSSAFGDDITAIGGAGGSNGSTPITGGSGGGACGGAGTAGSEGTVGQGNKGGNGGGDLQTFSAGGGGGGAGAPGQNASLSASDKYGGNGGNGLQYDISGSNIYYAGGGAGGGDGGTRPGNGGLGGGGNVAMPGQNGTGGGGGAGAGGVGGSGIVIVRYVTADFGACTGGEKTTVSNDTVHTFTSSGTFTVVAAPTPTPTPTITPTPTLTPTPTATPTKSMDSHGPPSAGSGMYSLQQVYDYLTSGTGLTVQTGFQEPASAPGPTMMTLRQLGDDVKSVFEQCATTTASDVKSGKPFFCTQPGNWGLKTGTGNICP